MRVTEAYQKPQSLAPAGRSDVTLINALGLHDQVFNSALGAQSG